MLLLCVSTLVHALTYVGYDPRDVSLTLWWVLQLSSAFVFIPGVIVVYFRAQEKDFERAPSIERAILGWAFFFFMLYALFNFAFTSIVLNDDGSPEVVNGQLTLVRHGAVIKILTREQFTSHQIYEARSNSGHWMVFYLIAIVALRWKMRQSERLRQRGNDAQIASVP